MLTCNGSKSFQKFIKGVTDLMENGLFEEEIVCGIEKLLEELLEKKTWLPLDKQKANSTQYARHLLYEDPLKRFEVLARMERWTIYTLHDHDAHGGRRRLFRKDNGAELYTNETT